MVIITVASLILLLITVFTLNDIFQGETFPNLPLTLVEASPEVKELNIIMIIGSSWSSWLLQKSSSWPSWLLQNRDHPNHIAYCKSHHCPNILWRWRRLSRFLEGASVRWWAIIIVFNITIINIGIFVIVMESINGEHCVFVIIFHKSSFMSYFLGFALNYSSWRSTLVATAHSLATNTLFFR